MSPPDAGREVVAGIDIGNSTTEVVLVEPATGVVAASVRRVTQGVKGSQESVAAAARAVSRLQRRHRLRLVAGAVAPLHPVRTSSRARALAGPDLGPLLLASREASTAAPGEAGLGRPLPIGRLAGDQGSEPAIVVVPGDVGYRQAAALLNQARRGGVPVAGVVAERDEAVLIANRLDDQSIPVVDQVAVDELLEAAKVAVEARPLGQPLRSVTDPFWLAQAFGLGADRPPVRHLAAELGDAACAVVALHPGRRRAAPASEDRVRWCEGGTSSLLEAVPQLRRDPPGLVAAVEWADADPEACQDVYPADLTAIADSSGLRRGTVESARLVTAVLSSRTGSAVDPAQVLAEQLGVPVITASSEAAAGRRGALSTPGVPQDAVVVDLGGGTVDASYRAGEMVEHAVLAGCGEQLTTVVAAALEVPRGLAEHAKRGPALYADGPHVVVDEKGSRDFVEVPTSAVGALCVHGPMGLTPFEHRLSLGEWRSWRLRAKQAVVGDNVARALTTLGLDGSRTVVLVGGAAGDDEVLASVTTRLPTESTVGRGNVHGVLGHRYAVAYGLALVAAVSEPAET